ncbi:hypothetical protein M9Y10_029796 [Tritrichomonas musculus]|uniref:Uncharacterized protein n=1 Tax=Tritrichomonas musculus TaxID=1915356 RepID=A0ABR2KNZ8_9EUKA
MEVDAYINKKKQLYDIFMNYIDCENDSEEYYALLTKLIEKQKIRNTKSELKSFLYLLSKISANHYRNQYFFTKIEKLVVLLKKDIINYFTNFEIFQFFEDEKFIYLILLNNGILHFDQEITDYILKKRHKCYKKFFYPEIKEFIHDEDTKRKIEEKIGYNTPDFKNFYEKRRIGENHSYICYLIRNDLVEEFIEYVNRSCISLSSSICKSIFETNNYLRYKINSSFTGNDKYLELIEYAAFYGSIQIFQFLRLNKVELNPILWMYAIHGNNPEIIHILEEDKVKMPNFNVKYNNEIRHATVYHYYSEESSHDFCLEKSIQCHHNDIAHYILNNYVNGMTPELEEVSFIYYNYEFIPNDFENHIYFFEYFLVHDYLDILSIAMKGMKDQLIEFIKKENDKKLKIQKEIKEEYGYTPMMEKVDMFYYAAKKNNIDIVNYLLFEFKPTIYPNCFDYDMRLVQITIPSFILELENKAFCNCESLKSVEFLCPLISIGDCAFYNCKSLKQIKIPSTVARIGKSAFKGSGITELKIPSNTTFIDISAFSDVKITEINIPSSISQIFDETFSGCSLLTRISFTSVKTIGKYAFSNCKLITTFLIPSSVIKIDDFSFAECSSLRELTVPSSVKKIGNSIWEGCSSLTKICLQLSIQKLEGNSFKNLLKLEEIELPPSLTIIGPYSFQNCISLKSIQIPSSVVIIDNNAFEECSSLKEVIINSKITSIGNNAFFGCSSLVSFTFPSSINSIGSFAFKGCSSLTKINISSLSLSLGMNCFEDCTLLEQAHFNCEIIKINECLFKNCQKLNEITIPNSVASFRSHCFENCSSLKSINVPSNATKICEFAFAGCSKLENISFPSVLKSIGRNAFDGCSSLKKLDLPYNLKSIGKNAFNECSSLTQISIPLKVNLKNAGIGPNVKLIKY